MNKKSAKYLFLVVSTFIFTTTGVLFFYNSSSFVHFLDWSKQNTVLYFLVLVVLKFVGVVYPPLPGGILTIGSIPILGWKYAYLADITGSFMGAVISFLIARSYGERVVKPFITEAILTKLKETKIKHKKQIEAVVVMRILGGSTIIEAVNYGAGLLNISLKNFILGFLISHPLTGIPLFYFASNIFLGDNTVVSVGIALISLFALYKIKGRYFE